MKHIVSISDYDRWSNYAEYYPRPRIEHDRALWNVILGWGVGTAVAIGIWYGFIWAAVGGYRYFHAFIDRIVGAF